jgi:hypothetical protein
MWVTLGLLASLIRVRDKLIIFLVRLPLRIVRSARLMLMRVWFLLSSMALTAGSTAASDDLESPIHYRRLCVHSL